METTVITANKEFEEIVRKACEKLNGPYWETYQKRAIKLKNNIANYKKVGNEIEKILKNKIKIKEVQIYGSLSEMDNQNDEVYYDLRLGGQSIGKVKYGISTKRCFDFYSKNGSAPIDLQSPEAKEHFEALINNGLNIQIPEHKLESLVLKNLAVNKGKQKIEDFKFIQPVKFGKAFFQMPTPLGGRDGKINTNGGHIDILARMSKKNPGWRLAVIELKCKYDPHKAPLKTVMSQALIYATCIAHLLTNKECGLTWYNIFREGIKGNVDKIPANIEILAMTMMPLKKGEITDEIDEKPIELHWGNNKTIKIIPCTCFLDVDDNFMNAYGSYLDYKRQAKHK